MALFGKNKKNAGQTLLVLDVESGSVGGALARVGEAGPRLFAQTRMQLPLFATRGSEVLARETQKAVHSVLLHLHTTAARLRNVESTSHLGEVGRSAVFLGAPWGTPNLAQARQDFIPGMQSFLASEMQMLAPDIPVSYHTGTDAAAYAAKISHPQGTLLLCKISGEITELLLLEPDAFAGYATIPTGVRTVLRTLKTHGGMSEAEVHSLFALAHQDAMPAYEPLNAAAEHFALEFAGAAQELLANTMTSGVLVIAQGPVGDIFARALEDAAPAHLFPQGGIVQTLRTHHVLSREASHAPQTDLSLLLGALFADAKFNRV